MKLYTGWRGLVLVIEVAALMYLLLFLLVTLAGVFQSLPQVHFVDAR